MTSVRPWRRVLECALGLALVLVGIAGLVLPGIQGVLLILAGLAVLSRHSPLAKRLYDGMRERARRAGARLRRR